MVLCMTFSCQAQTASQIAVQRAQDMVRFQNNMAYQVERYKSSQPAFVKRTGGIAGYGHTSTASERWEQDTNWVVYANNITLIQNVRQRNVDERTKLATVIQSKIKQNQPINVESNRVFVLNGLITKQTTLLGIQYQSKKYIEDRCKREWENAWAVKLQESKRLAKYGLN